MEHDQHTELEIMRHSFSHVLAFAVWKLYKNVKLGIGPVVENGFYHDFLFEEPIGEDDLIKIEEEIKKIIEKEYKFQQIIVSREQAYDILHLQGQIFKTEILSSIEGDEVSFFKTGREFIDLCRGPHVEHTGKLGAFKLTNISGSNWNNDETRPKLQRIHGLAFATQQDLDEFLAERDRKKGKDHKNLGIQLDLYAFANINGGGLPLWLPKGNAIRKKIMDYIYKENVKAGYSYVETPSISRTELFNKSKDLAVANKGYMFNPFEVENDKYSLRPRAFAHHIEIYKYKKRSYRELPYKISEFARVFRNEQSGELNGLSRLREFTNESNICILDPDTLKEEIISNIGLTTKIYQDFGLKDFKIELSLKGPNDSYYFDNQKEWNKHENIIVDALKTGGFTAHESPNTAERVGPGINFKFKDVQDREWKLGTIFLDLEAPQLFDISYASNNGKDKKPIVMYRTSIGSVERFFALLLEHLEGAFPLWLAPTQVSIIPISEKYIEYSRTIYEKLVDLELNVYFDSAPETMQNKIRDAQVRMIPYMLVIGDKEQSNNTVSVRPRSGQDLGMTKLEEFIQKIESEIENKVVF